MTECEKYHRKPWMSDDQWQCAEMIADLFFGWHHVQGEIKKFGSGIQLNTTKSNWAATYDYDGLTRGVVLAHDRMIRFELCSSGPRMMRLVLHKRHTREGRMHERHPTLEDAIVAARKAHPSPEHT